jgi:hypothetical protein
VIPPAIWRERGEYIILRKIRPDNHPFSTNFHWNENEKIAVLHFIETICELQIDICFPQIQNLVEKGMSGILPGN